MRLATQPARMSPKLPVGTENETGRCGRAERDRAGEVIDDLRGDARPVDRIDAREAAARRESARSLNRAFTMRLAIVERALDRERMDVRRVDRRHLPALHLRHAPMRVEDEDVDLIEALERLDRGAAGIARGRADDGGARASRLAAHGPSAVRATAWPRP